MNYNTIRNKTKEIKIGNVKIGGNNPILVQSMTNTSSLDFEATYNQIVDLQNHGCDIVRMAIPDFESTKTLYKLKSTKNINIPIVADIHFDYKLAIESVNAGADKIRINPGNIVDKNKIKQIVTCCNKNNIPIRIGVNSGSLDKEVLKKYGAVCPEALVESAENEIKLLNYYDFDNIVVSVKSSNVLTMVKTNEMLSQKFSYPIHVGVTEAGTYHMGLLKSAVGIGSLLSQGIGDTIRISLTDIPQKEVDEGINLLKVLDLYHKNWIQIISCPTCGRTKINIINLANDLQRAIDSDNLNKNLMNNTLTVAVMGCAVNGPGEAKGADIGVAGGIGEALLFKKGKIIKKIPEEAIVNELINEIKKMI